MNEFEVRITRKVKRDDIIQLYKDAGWWRQEYSLDPSFIDRLVCNSFCFVGAFHKKKMVGMGRSISDGASDAYILDVTVLKKYRGKGIGTRIILKILERIKSRGIDWATVIAEPGTEEFYRKAGFRVMKGFVPLRLKQRK